MTTTDVDDIRRIAAEAYVFAYPLLMNYRSHYVVVINEAGPFFKAPYNQIVHDTQPADHTRRDVVMMNADTPYSNFGLDLRAEPVVVSVPQVTDRYYVMQCVDFYTHNFAYIGTRSTGTAAGDFLFVGPKWSDDIDDDRFTKVYRCETDFMAVICRTQLKGLDDLATMRAVQDSYQITPMSVFLDEDPRTAPPVDWPKWDDSVMTGPEFIELLNFLLPLYEPFHPDDRPLLERFATIGIAPGEPFDPATLANETRGAIQDGIDSAIAQIADRTEHIGEQVNGWNMTDAIGPRDFFHNDWLLRAAAAQSAMYMNDKIEAFYPLAWVDGDGDTLDGSLHDYTLRFEPDQIPPARFFWSVTMYDRSYDGLAGYLVDNEIDRYLINSTTEGLRYDDDGSLTVYIQHDSPDADRASNWLPAPAAPFYMCIRIYGPHPPVMDGTWTPQPITKTTTPPNR